MHDLGRPIARLLFAALVAAALLLPPLEGPAAGETIRACVSELPSGLDPHRTVDPVALTYIMPAYQRLTGFKEGTTEIEPDLALTWRVSRDGRLYTFVLAQGARFSNGAPVDARAAAFSFRRLLEQGGPATGLFPDLTDAEVLGPYTLRLVLSRPSSDFLHALAGGAGSIVSPAAANHAPGYLDRHTLGSGRYELTSWHENVGLTMACPASTDPRPAVDRFETLLTPNQGQQKEMLCEESAQYIDAPPPSSRGAFEYEPRVGMGSAPRLNIRVAAINARRPWLEALEARQGLSMALDYEALAGGPDSSGQRLFGPLPMGVWGRSADPSGPAYDPSMAAALSAEAGAPNRPLVLAYNPQTPGMERQAGIIARNLKALGLVVETRPYSGAKPPDDDYDLALLDFSPRTGAPEDYFHFLAGPGNPAGYEGSGVMETVDNAGAAGQDKSSRLALYRQAAEQLIRDASYAFLYQGRQSYGFSRALTHHTPHPFFPRVVPLGSMGWEPLPPPESPAPAPEEQVSDSPALEDPAAPVD